MVARWQLAAENPQLMLFVNSEGNCAKQEDLFKRDVAVLLHRVEFFCVIRLGRPTKGVLLVTAPRKEQFIAIALYSEDSILVYILPTDLAIDDLVTLPPESDLLLRRYLLKLSLYILLSRSDTQLVEKPLVHQSSRLGDMDANLVGVNSFFH